MNNEKIYELMECVRKEMNAGFSELHKRIDGQVTKNGAQNERLGVLETKMVGVWWLVGTVMVAVVGVIIRGFFV